MTTHLFHDWQVTDKEKRLLHDYTISNVMTLGCGGFVVVEGGGGIVTGNPLVYFFFTYTYA